MIITTETALVPHGNGSKLGARTDGAYYVLTSYYRCPEGLKPVLPARQPAGRPGYFRFGQDTICYGRLADGRVKANPDAELVDALDLARFEVPQFRLPFDGGDVVENLRREGYTAHFREEGRVLNDALWRV